MENSLNERGKHQVTISNDDDEINFVSARIASQSFGKSLGKTDTEDSILASSRRYVWYQRVTNDNDNNNINKVRQLYILMLFI